MDYLHNIKIHVEDEVAEMTFLLLWFIWFHKICEFILFNPLATGHS